MTHWLLQLDKSWTLFLDRDGVLNEEISGDYVRNIQQLKLYEDIGKTIASLNNIFGRIVIVTNQRCVGKGIITMQELEVIHTHLLAAIAMQGGRIDKIYIATAVDSNDENRKPNIGMALQAKEDFPEIDFTKSVMVGNSFSDIAFGLQAGMKTVFVKTTQVPPSDFKAHLITTDLAFATLFFKGEI